MLKPETILGGKLPNVKVGIGCAPDSKFAEVSVRAIDNPNITIYRDPAELATDLASGKIDAAVRGDMSSSKLLPLVKKSLELDHLDRIVFYEIHGKVILSAPVGIDEGWSVESKLEMAERSVELLGKFGVKHTKIAVMSGGRSEDMGRIDIVDKSITDALEVTRTLVRRGYDAYHAQILIEDAVDEADVIIAPGGISGNIIFRTLHFIGGISAYGAPVVNTDKVFVDTSRVKTDYTDSITLAMKLVEMKK